MNRLLTATLALSLLGGSVALAQPGFPNNPGPNTQGPKGDQDRNDRDNNDRGRGDQTPPRPTPPNNPPQSNPRWSRGDRLPQEYRQPQTVARDWRQQGLRTPPRGYQWVRDQRGNYYLARTTTGVIAQTVYRDEREQSWNRRYSRTYTYNDDNYYRECRTSSDPAGVLIGAIIGGLIGNAAGNDGNRTGATLAGVILGGAAGAALTRDMDCEDRSYAYRTYYQGFNAGRPGASYNWTNPRNNHRGALRVGTYYNDPGGFRCTNFTQTIYIGGRAQQATGRACRQPDGTWAIVN